jgi:hypothetical protein
MGDLLLAVVALARKLKVNPEDRAPGRGPAIPEAIRGASRPQSRKKD